MQDVIQWDQENFIKNTDFKNSSFHPGGKSARAAAVEFDCLKDSPSAPGVFLSVLSKSFKAPGIIEMM